MARRRRRARLAGSSDIIVAPCGSDGRYVITKCGRPYAEWCLFDSRTRSVVLRRKVLSRVKNLCKRMG